MKDPQKKKKLNIEIGSRIKFARNQRKLTQEQLADQIDVSVQYISDLERGVTGSSIGTIVNVCHVLDVSADYLLLGKTPAPDPLLEEKLKTITPAQKACMMEIIEKVISLTTLENEI